jgi:hypothetical protein
MVETHTPKGKAMNCTHRFSSAPSTHRIAAILVALCLGACGGGSSQSDTEVATNDSADDDDAMMEDSAAGTDEGAETSESDTSDTQGDAADGSESSTDETTDEADDATADSEESGSEAVADANAQPDEQSAAEQDTDAEQEPAGEEASVQSSGSDDEGVLSIDTDIPRETPLGELTPEQQQQLCEDLDAAVSGGALAVAQCELFGGLLAALAASDDTEYQELCASSADDCMQGLDEEGSFECNTDEIPEDCEATIGDYESCVNQSFDALPPLDCSSTLAEATAILLVSAAVGDTGAMADTPECQRVDACTPDDQSMP